MPWYEILAVCAIVCISAIPIICRQKRRRSDTISVPKRSAGSVGRSKE